MFHGAASSAARLRGRSRDEQVLADRDRRQARTAEQFARRLTSELLGR
ncbi:hypothetical protein [Kitasatospora sp. MMS16-BH015]|nr:hypothetical protein [Kitasatospora sp. MMS16-BH015]